MKGNKTFDNRLKELLETYEALFRDDLPSGIPRNRNIDHEIIIEENRKPLHITLFKLSPEVLKGNEYFRKKIKNNIRPIRSPYGDTIFFVKENVARLTVFLTIEHKAVT